MSLYLSVSVKLVCGSPSLHVFCMCASMLFGASAFVLSASFCLCLCMSSCLCVWSFAHLCVHLSFLIVCLHMYVYVLCGLCVLPMCVCLHFFFV